MKGTWLTERSRSVSNVVVRGRSPDQIRALLDSTQAAIVEAFGTPERDRYQLVTEHSPGDMIIQDHGLGIERSENIVIMHMINRPREIPDPASTTGPVAELLTRLERGVEQHFRAKPARIMWPMRDPGFTPAVLGQWRKTLPDAPVTQLDDASHYIQEDAHERVVPQLLSFVAGT